MEITKLKRQFFILLLLLVILATGAVHHSRSAVQDNRATNSNAPTNFERNVAKKELKLDSTGVRIPINYECLDRDCNDEAKVSVLTSGQVLIGICDVLFMLDANEKVVWEYNVPQLLLDFTFIPSTGLIYGTAGDNNMFILEASTGRELMQNGRNGSFAYGEVKPYGSDMCLITDNNWGYRERLSDPTIMDGVTCWRGTDILWSMELPPGAELIVRGTRISTITESNGGIFIKEIAVPEAKSQ